MNKSTFAVAAAVLLCFGAGTVLSQQTPPPSRQGFVDMGGVFEQYRRREDIEARLNLKTSALENRMKRARAEIDELRGAMPLLSPESKEFAEKQKELAIRTFMLKYERESLLKELEADARRQKALLYKEITEEVAAYGETHGLAAIFLWMPITEELSKRGDMDLLTSTRTVLWFNEDLDVTADIVELLNASLPPVPKAPEKDPEPGESESDEDK